MTHVNLTALLPASDGTGWYVVEPNDRPHVCSIQGCDNPAVVYHHATQGQSKIWRNRYRCAECLDPSMEIRGGRVWRDSSVEMVPPAHVESTVAS